MCENLIDFPELITLNEFGGNYEEYENALLELYEADLWKGGLTFFGLNVVPRVHKRFEFNGKTLDWTFAHFTSKGEIEEDRELDLRRCEKIGFIKPIIENIHLDCVKVWENTRLDKKNKPQTSVVIWCECVNCKIVLTKKNGKNSEYYVITTFYLINSPSKILKHNNEYDEYVAKFGKII
ncbi:hypothetical protein [Chryseobacterium cucumeris]|uniref:hypothetical protein n=1 Tax=Chryseobacterium cucumeris TaxID=1813611 RepID=UPI002457D9F1|nr:hypothetical protein [Chryseobacterium cucumeris]MDH5035434.1 hypothetical protein [Chryseobacterium cucumeris]